MVAPIKFISTLLLATAGSAHAYTSSSAGVKEFLGLKSTPADALAVADVALRASCDAHELMPQMQAYVEGGGEEVVDAVCTQAGEDTNCREAVAAYLERCAGLDCLTLDVVKYPEGREYQPLALPDPYQLDAAFYVLKHCEGDPFRRQVKEKMALFRGDGQYAEFHTFLLNLAINNNQFYRLTAEEQDLDAFVRRYVFMATLFYKTYTLLDVKQARLMDKVGLARHLFGGKIERALKAFIKRNLPDDFGKYNVARLKHVMDGYGDYMQTQVPALPGFAKRFAVMVTKTLVKSVGHYQKLPWYRRLYRHLTGFFKKNVHEPTTEFFKETIPGAMRGFAEGTKQRFRRMNDATNAGIQRLGDATIGNFQRMADKTGLQRFVDANAAGFKKFGKATEKAFTNFGNNTKKLFTGLRGAGNDDEQELVEGGDAEDVEGGDGDE
uniref:Rhoptry-associated protein-1c n=1 Tax=Babesia gibsoni TaxID=33632 RepID=C6L650_BABGI|nr:rhoptry-associated protein-1c [Babesia gibsoni]